MTSVRTIRTPVLDLRFAEQDLVTEFSSGKLFSKERRVEEERYSGSTGAVSLSAVSRRSMDSERPTYFRSSSRGAKSPRAGVRRMQRFFNHAQLKKHADPEDLEDPERLKRLFDVKSPSLFRDLVGDPETQKCFEPFLFVTEETEQKQLDHLCGNGRKRHGSSKSHRADKHRADLRYEQMDRLALACAQNGQYIQRGGVIRERSLICIFPLPLLFLCSRKVRALISARPQFVLSVLETMETEVRSCVQVGQTMELDTSVYRMIAHGLAQFYGMRSWSEDTSDGSRLTVFKPTKNTVVPHITLSDFIQQRRSPCTGNLSRPILDSANACSLKLLTPFLPLQFPLCRIVSITNAPTPAAPDLRLDVNNKCVSFHMEREDALISFPT